MTALDTRPDGAGTTRPALRLAAVVLVVALAVAVRASVIDYRSGDWVGYVRDWYAFVEGNGGFAALREKFANYNMPYLYLLAAVTYLPVEPLLGVKLIAIVFDAVLGWFSYRLLSLRWPGSLRAVLGAGVVVLLPDVVLNGSAWGQSDATYTACAVAALYFVLRRRPWAASVALGLAFAFKLQIVFLAPALLALVLLGRIPWRTLVAIPAVYLLLDVPALLLGANPRDVLLIYLDQTATLDLFTTTTPNVYRFLGDTGGSPTTWAVGTLVAGVVLIGLLVALVRGRRTLTDDQVLLVTCASALLVPFLLPRMHERYFFTGGVLAVLAAFWLGHRPLRPVPALVAVASLFSYLPFLLLPDRLAAGLGDPGISDGFGFAGGVDLFGIFSTLPGRPDLFATVFAPVVDYRMLAAANAVAIALVLAVTVRELRIPAVHTRPRRNDDEEEPT